MLKIHIQPFEKAAVIQILDQDMRQIYSGGSSEKPYEFVASNGLKIRSNQYPDYRYQTSLCLRGYITTHDEKLILVNFNTNADRDAEIERIKLALKEWAEQGGFNPSPKADSTVPSDHVYEF